VGAVPSHPAIGKEFSIRRRVESRAKAGRLRTLIHSGPVSGVNVTGVTGRHTFMNAWATPLPSRAISSGKPCVIAMFGWATGQTARSTPAGV